MVTIIKVKRKIDEDPADCLIIECKKKKTSNNGGGSDSIKQILKFVGSAKSENDIPEKISELNKTSKKKEDVKNDYKCLTSKYTSKETRVNDNVNKNQEIKSQRYVLVNKKRGLNEENEDINVIDVISSEYSEEEVKSDKQGEDEITCNGVALIKEKIETPETNSKYIYDIYYAKNDETYLDLLYANSYNIQSHILENDDLAKKNEEIYEDDDDDSNDENNWRNDYPDEGEGDDYYNEGDHDYDEYDYRLSSMMKKSCTMDNYDDEYYDDSNYYNDDDDDEYKTESVAYATYKKKILKEFNDDDF